MTLRTSCEAADFSQNPQISYESCGLYYSLHLSAQKHTMCVLLVKFVLKFLHRKQILRLHVLRLSETISCFLSAALCPAHCTDQLCPCYAFLHPQPNRAYQICNFCQTKRGCRSLRRRSSRSHGCSFPVSAAYRHACLGYPPPDRLRPYDPASLRQTARSCLYHKPPRSFD